VERRLPTAELTELTIPVPTAAPTIPIPAIPAKAATPNPRPTATVAAPAISLPEAELLRILNSDQT